MPPRLRPFFPFYGSKWNIARYYPAPRYPVTIEPFAGSAGYSTYHGVDSAWLLDADPIVCAVWQYLLRVSEAEIRALPLLPAVGDSVDDVSLPQEAKWLIGFWLNRGSSQPKKARTAYSARTDRAQLNWGARAIDRIASQLPAIRNWRVLNGRTYTDAPDVGATWFIDPPYVDKGRYYRKRIDDYSSLAQWATNRRGQLLVCEGAKGTWLPFSELGTYKSSRGRAIERVYVA